MQVDKKEERREKKEKKCKYSSTYVKFSV